MSKYLLLFINFAVISAQTTSTCQKTVLEKAQNVTINSTQVMYTTRQTYQSISTSNICLWLSHQTNQNHYLLVVVHNFTMSTCTVVWLLNSNYGIYYGQYNQTELSFEVTDFNDKILVVENYRTLLQEATIFKYPSSCQAADVTLPQKNHTLLQQRVDNCLSFGKTWKEYSVGFGHPTGNYWAGLQMMHYLTWNNPRRIRFEMKRFSEDTLYYAEYSSFKVGPANDLYRLYISGYDSGVSTVGDSMTSGINLNNMEFSTSDNGPRQSCSGQRTNAGFWFSLCTHSSPNGNYTNKNVDGLKHIYWQTLFSRTPISYFRMSIYLQN